MKNNKSQKKILSAWKIKNIIKKKNDTANKLLKNINSKIHKYGRERVFFLQNMAV